MKTAGTAVAAGNMLLTVKLHNFHLWQPAAAPVVAMCRAPTQWPQQRHTNQAITPRPMQDAVTQHTTLLH
jgi:hypothetical protein